MHSIIELAECRRQDFYAEAARERLAKEARPDRPLAASSPESLLHTMRPVRASIVGALAAFAINPCERGSVKRTQTMMPAAR